MKPTLHTLLISLLLFAGSGCDELIVKDISRKTIVVVTPSADAVLSDGNVRFSWETLEYADYYRLILVSQTLSEVGATVADTLLDGNTFVPLEPLPSGSYEWRIQAHNSEYQTRPQSFSFRVQMAKDIREETVELLSPQDKAELLSSTVGFSWEPLDGAESYRLVVVSPEFGSAQQMLVDSILTVTHCRVELSDAHYQWRLQALNDEFTSLPATASFRVNSIPDLSSKTVDVVSPKNNNTLTHEDVLFAWTSVPGAEQYRITIVSPDFGNLQRLVEDTHTEETSFRTTLPNGAYQWQVQALNSASQSQVKTHSFLVASSTVKDISQQQVAIIAPSNGIETTNRNVTFAWYGLEGATSYRLLIVSPSFDRVESLLEDISQDGTSYRIELPAGTYQWRIQALNEKYKTAPQTYSLKITEPSTIP